MSSKFKLSVVCLTLVVGAFLFRSPAATRADDKKTAGEKQTEKKQPAKKAEKKPTLQKFMHAKLELSQDLLHGLVIEDFDRIEKRARAMSILTVAEEWNVSNDPLYKQHSDQFSRTAKQIVAAAEKQNLDAASLGFVQLTMTCIECHRFVRNQLVTKE